MTIYIDYNAEMPDGRFFARESRIPNVGLGQIVQTEDEDGRSLVMQVDEIDEATGLVYFRPDWTTWVDRDPEAPEAEHVAGVPDVMAAFNSHDEASASGIVFDTIVGIEIVGVRAQPSGFSPVVRLALGEYSGGTQRNSVVRSRTTSFAS